MAKMVGASSPPPAWGSDDLQASVLHVDMDAFFAEVELLEFPHLRGRPVVVGGQQRGVVLSATYEARAMGIHSAMPIAHARSQCPELIVLPPHHERYTHISREVMAVLGDITPVVEQVSIDEAFLDVAGAVRRLGPPMSIARQIRHEIRRRVGVPASVGLGATKFVAKLASGFAKPDGIYLVPKQATVDFLHSLPVGALWGVGTKTRKRLEQHGVETVAQLADYPLAQLQRLLGTTAGRRLHDLAHGRDPRAVEPQRIEKSIGTERTFAHDIADREALHTILLELSHRVAARLRRSQMAAASLSLKLRYPDFTTVTRSRSIMPSDVAHEIHATAAQLLDSLHIPPTGVRLLGIRGEQLVPGHHGRQLRLDETDHRREAEAAMDGVRQRFGPAALRPASLLRGKGRD